MPLEKINKIRVYVISIAGLLGGLLGAYEMFIVIKSSMDKTAKEKIESFTLPVVQQEINKTVDSIFSNQSKSVVVGLRFDPDSKELYYIHINGKTYRAFLDSVDNHYYFINDLSRLEWCK